MASSDDSLTVRIEGGPPFGFRLFGGDGQPLVIAKLRRKSKAWDAGLEEGDLLLNINDHSCRNISHAAAMNLVDSAGHFLNLRILRKGWGVSGQLQVSRAGSRQRSVTPTTFTTRPLVPFQATPSPEHPRVQSTQSSVQWSSRTTSQVHNPMVNSVQQKRTFEIHLSEPETGRPGDDDDDDAWNRSSKSLFHHAKKEQARSPSNGPLLFSVAATPPPLQPISRASEVRNKSSAAWKPPAWKPEPMEPTGNSLSQETNKIQFNSSVQNSSRENAPAAAWKPPAWKQEPMEPTGNSLSKETNAIHFQNSSRENVAAWKPPSWQAESSRTTFLPPDNRMESTPSFNSSSNLKENVSPAVNRSTPSFQTNRVEVAKHKPNVWQPNAIPQVRKTFPVPSPVMDSGLDVDVSDGGGGRGWKPPMRNDGGSSAGGFGKNWSEMPAHVNKIISGNVEDDEEFDAMDHDKEKKIVFVDSSFYRDPAHKYPTVDEQIKMARQVAMSLTAPSNEQARGHRMFMKRKEKADKWVVDAAGLDLNVRGSDTEGDLYYNPKPWNAASGWKADHGGSAGFSRDVAPPPLPTSKLFAPKLNPEDESGERSKALSAEEFERLRLFSQKTTHNMINPQVCFTLAEDLRNAKGKGGRMFAKRRAKSDEWTIEGEKGAPDAKLMQKISGGYAPVEKKPTPIDRDTRSDEVELLAPTTNRLKEMIELPKAKITPWDAVAEFGNVDMAFEHLEGINFLRPKGSAYADSVASSLQQATTRRRTSDLTSSRPTSAKVPPQSHPSPSNWNRTKEFTATDNRLGNKASPHSPGYVDFSPSSYGSGGGSGYRPVAFQSSSENASVTGRFSDL